MLERFVHRWWRMTLAPHHASDDGPLAMLRREHEAISELADATKRAIESSDGGAKPAARQLWQAATGVLLALAEQHHGKEEAVLMSYLELRGFSRATRPLAAVLADHRRHDDLLDAVVAALARAADDPRALVSLRVAFARYRAHLERYIEREEHILLPLAARVLAAADAEEVMRRFGMFIELSGGAGWYAGLMESAERIRGAETRAVERTGMGGGA